MYLLLLLGTLPLRGPLPPAAGDWTTRTLPALCRHAGSAGPAELRSANHLPFPGELPQAQEQGQPPLLVPILLQLLEEELRDSPDAARLEVGGERLLIAGSADAVTRIDRVLAGLAAFERHLTASYTASLTIGEGESSTWQGRLGPGEGVALGVRRTLSYLGDQDVNVASDSGVATPETHQALLGRTLHLSISPLIDGHHLIEGTLDLSELGDLRTFDPESADMGLVELPRLNTAQVRFSSIDEADILLTGLPAPLERVELLVRVPVVEPTAVDAPWQVFDLAALTQPAPPLHMVEGGELGEESAPAPPSPPKAWDAGTLASLAGTGAGPAPLWSGHLLFVRRGSPAEERTRELLTELESHLTPFRVELRWDGVRAELPLVRGREARLVAGVEERHVTGVGSQIAPSTWMPQLHVARTFDGVLLSTAIEASQLQGWLRMTSSEPAKRADSKRTGLTAIELLQRAVRGRSVSVPLTALGEEITLFGALGAPAPQPAISLRLTALETPR